MFRRNAGDVFKKNDIRYYPDKRVGEGAFGLVLEGERPGTVVKKMKDFEANPYNPTDSKDEALLEMMEMEGAKEAYLQQLAASRGLAPPVYRVGSSSQVDGPVIEMRDMRDNYVTAKSVYGQNVPPSVRVKTQQQVGQMALMGIDEVDRNSGNILINKFTGKPIQIDFGVSEEVGIKRGDFKQIRALRNATEQGLRDAGLNQEAEIYNDLVTELMREGDLVNAFDVAKQGFSRLQKIDAARLPNKIVQDYMPPTGEGPIRGLLGDSLDPFRGPDSTTRRRVIQEMLDRGEIPF